MVRNAAANDKYLKKNKKGRSEAKNFEPCGAKHTHAEQRGAGHYLCKKMP